MVLATVLRGRRAGAFVLGLPVDQTVALVAKQPNVMIEPAVRGEDGCERCHTGQRRR